MADLAALAQAELARLDKAKETSLGIEWDNYIAGARLALEWIAGGGVAPSPVSYVVSVLGQSVKALGG